MDLFLVSDKGKLWHAYQEWFWSDYLDTGVALPLPLYSDQVAVTSREFGSLDLLARTGRTTARHVYFPR